MNKQDIPFLSATELASQIRERKISPVEAVEAYLERIEQVDPKLNAYITILRMRRWRRHGRQSPRFLQGEAKAHCTVFR